MILTESDRKLDIVLSLEVDDEELIKRLSGRRICSKCDATYHLIFNPPKEDKICDKCEGKLYQCEDDTPDAIINRLIVDKRQTQPLVGYYIKKGLLQTIDGEGNISKIFEDIKEVLERYD